MNVEKVKVMKMSSQPEVETRTDGELTQWRDRWTPAFEGQHRHTLVVMPLANGQGKIEARASIIGGQNRGVDTLSAQGANHANHRRTGTTTQGADRGDDMKDTNH